MRKINSKFCKLSRPANSLLANARGQMFIELTAMFPVFLMMVLMAVEFSRFEMARQRVFELTKQIASGAKRMAISPAAATSNSWMSELRTNVDNLLATEFPNANERPGYIISLFKSRYSRVECIASMVDYSAITGTLITASYGPGGTDPNCAYNMSVLNWSNYNVTSNDLFAIIDRGIPVVTVELYFNYLPMTPVGKIFNAGPAVNDNNASLANRPELYFTTLL